MKLLETLSNASGVSGSEEDVRAIIRKEIKKSVDNVYVDTFGNLIAHKRGKPPRVMLAAHMDEIGMMVKHINNDGTISLSFIGGLDVMPLVGRLVSISSKKGKVMGMITLKEISNFQDIDEIPDKEELIVDTGLTKKQLQRRGAEAGSYIVFEQQFKVINKEGVVCGKALDDRIGCYILIELAKKLKKAKNEMFFVFTVQEEVGLYGAKTSAYHIEPDWAIAVDVTNADDVDNEKASKLIGKGPTITVKDADMIANKCVDDWLKDLAKKKRIPYQIDVSDAGTTDAMNISISKGGVPSSVVGVAIRNLHTTFGVAHKNDIENAIKLLYELLLKPPKVCLV